MNKETATCFIKSIYYNKGLNFLFASQKRRCISSKATIHKQPAGFWDLKQNQREFLENFALKNRIQYPQDWGKITTRKIKTSNGTGLLRKYDSSIYRCLRSNFPGKHFSHRNKILEVDWKKEWFYNLPVFPHKKKNFWRNSENARTFLDNLASRWEIKNPQDWNKIKTFHILDAGGSGLLAVYNNSLFEVLRQVYSEHRWEKKWFSRLFKFPRDFWKIEKNQREFLDSVALEYNISSIHEWQRVSLSLIRNKGGEGFLKVYQGSLTSAFKSIYGLEFPEINVSNKHKKLIERTSNFL